LPDLWLRVRRQNEALPEVRGGIEMIESAIQYLTDRLKEAEYTGESRCTVAVAQLTALVRDHAALTQAVRQLSAAVEQYRRDETQKVQR
jgi:hypothetical protein